MNRAKPSFWIYLINKTAFGNGTMLFLLSSQLLIGIVAMVVLISSNSFVSIPDPFVPLVIFLTFIIGIVIGIGLVNVGKKFQELSSIFANGDETIGEVVVVYFSRGHGYITYEYQYRQKTIRSTDTINQNQKTKVITVGQQVVLYVNLQQPRQAFIRDLYLNTF